MPVPLSIPITLAHAHSVPRTPSHVPCLGMQALETLVSIFYLYYLAKEARLVYYIGPQLYLSMSANLVTAGTW